MRGSLHCDARFCSDDFWVLQCYDRVNSYDCCVQHRPGEWTDVHHRPGCVWVREGVTWEQHDIWNETYIEMT